MSIFISLKSFFSTSRTPPLVNHNNNTDMESLEHITPHSYINTSNSDAIAWYNTNLNVQGVNNTIVILTVKKFCDLAGIWDKMPK